MSGRRKPKRRRRWLLPALLLGLAALLADSRLRLVTDEYTCPVAGLPAEFDGFRIVQLSDLHGASFGRDNTRLLETVERAQPDIIALTGDFVEKEEDLAVTAALLPRLAAIAPCYFVSGNHEWASGCMETLQRQLDAAGVVSLHNEFLPLARGESRLVLCGVEDPNSWADMIRPPELIEQLRATYPAESVVLLGHRNYWVEEYPALPVDVILCGHGHGGVIRLPGIGGLLGTDRQLFPDYDAGVYTGGTYTMVVSRGLGNIFRMPRFLNNPEIVAVTLEKVS